MPFGGGVSIPAPQPVNLSGLQSLAQTTAQQNVTGSLNLQNQIYPGLNNDQQQALGSVSTNINNPVQFNPASVANYGGSPLLNQAANYASSQLALGDQLPADVQAQVAQQAGANSFSSGLRGEGLAGVTAADLGLNSLQLGQQRFANAQSIGDTQTSTSLAQQQLQTAVNEFNSQYGASVNLQNRAQGLTGAALLTGIQPPQSGLSPGDLASVSVGNTNSQNAYNQQVAEQQAQQQSSNNALFGQLLGLVLAPATGGASLALSVLNSLNTPSNSQYNANGSINLG